VKRSVYLPLLLLALLGAAPAIGAGADPGRGAVSGQVLEGGIPLASVQVYAYQLVDRTLRLATTGGGGEFLFDALPAGLYKLVAFKRGFLPAVVMLTRASRDAAQWVELQLAPAAGQAEPGRPGEEFWSLREQVPADVLRELQTGGTETLLAAHEPPGTPRPGFAAAMSAETGTLDLPDGAEAAMTGGEVRLEGQLRGLLLRLDGDYRQLAPESFAGGMAGQGGEASSLAVRLAHGSHGELDLRSRVNRLNTFVGDELVPVDFQQYGVRWSGSIGSTGESALSAWYTEENGLHAQGPVAPAAIPIASRSVRLEGTYARPLTRDAGLRAGLRFRQRTGSYLDELLSASGGRLSTRQLEAFGGGDLLLGERVELEYGLAGGLHENGVAVTPRAGVGVGLGGSWRGEALVSHRFEMENDDRWGQREFLPLLVVEEDPCEMAGLSCYQLGVRRGNEENLFAVELASRDYDRTVRLYFSRDFFDQFESLFLVPGDRVPEVRVTLSRQFGGFLVARWESIAALGGGGTFLAADQNAYRNGVTYLVTSLDTRFLNLGTGVLLAFQRLSQDLEPLDSRRPGLSSLDAERLQLTLVQDLNVFFDLSTEWAMRVNMELARGTTAYGDQHPFEGFRRRITTGLSVRF